MTTTSERRQRILQILMERGNVQVSDLSPSFNVSTVTIRNDLSFFEDQGLVTRTYGGAYLKGPATQESGARAFIASFRRTGSMQSSPIGICPQNIARHSNGSMSRS